MKILASLFVLFLVLVILVGGVSLAFTAPFWVCGLHGLVGAFGVYQAMECLSEIWKA